MSFLRSILQSLRFAAVLVATASAAASPHVNVRPQARILSKIDSTNLTLRPQTTTARLSQAVDRGRVDANTHFSHMMLVLRSSDEQEFALAGLLDTQQDKSSPNYHQWITPEAFGATFGVASSDLAQITAWLQDSGFTVDSVAKGARIIQFSGTSSQVEAAFHTEMHTWLVNGETHVANSKDISIPSALASVVAGVRSLNDFKPHANLVNPRRAVPGRDGQMVPALAGTNTPDYTSTSTSNHYVGAGDLATIFNTRPLLAGGIDGAGVTIGILGQTDILLSDVQIYRGLFNLPKNDPNFIQVGADPGTIPDDAESDLDVELSGAIAPMATINFYTSGNSYFGGGVDASGVYAVEDNSVDIISLSYGECEADLGSGGNAFYNALWEQAAAQGQTVFVSSGDSGPSTCNSSGAAYSTTGYGVNGDASTPFNVAVGGTMFNDGTATGVTSYWGAPAGAPYLTALSYIPEIPWNEGRFDIYPNGLGGIVGGGSGISLYYGTPSFQAGPGVPSSDPTPNGGTVSGFVVPGPHRYLPDVSLEAAAAHDATIYCSEGSCQLNANGTVASIGLVGGTSVAAPSMAGVQALINQKNGGRQGNANYFYYRVAATQSQTNCVSATYLTTADATCGFHDLTTGNINVPGNSAGTSILGWSAGAGYDLAAGLGSPDATNLANLWSTITFNATTTSLTLTPTTGLVHGGSQNVSITVASGSGTPTGDVSIIATTSNGGAGTFTQFEASTSGSLSFTLSSGSASGTLSGLPAGTYTVYAHYAGDTTYGGSNSTPISVTISPEGSILSVNAYLLAANGGFSSANSFPYGANVYIDAQVAGASGTGTPSGKVTFALTKGSTPLTPVVNSLDTFADTYFDAGLGLALYAIMPTGPVLSPGAYSANITYSGDTSFNTSIATPIAFTVIPANQTLNLSAVSAEIGSGATATFNASIMTVSPAAGGVPATGSVTFTDSTTNTILGTANLGANGAAVFTTTAITTNGAHSITATYSGDANYLAATSAAVTTTVGGAASTVTLTASTTSAPVGTSVTLTATVPAGATGTVFFYDTGVSLGGATISTATLTAALTVSTFAARTHSITATYSGNSAQAASTSAALTITITQNVPAVQLTVQQSNANNSAVAMNAIVVPSQRGSSGNNPPPTGLVQFMDGTTVLGTSTPVYLPGGSNNYVATFTTQALKPGPHTLTASYLGDTNFATATSNPQSLGIGLTTPTVTASTTSVGTGVAFTLTDRILPQAASASPVSGTVTFYDGTTPLGTSTVTNALAVLSTAILVGVGPHSITAVYSGDANFYTSTTSPASITVIQTPSATTLAVSAATIQFGNSVTLTATAPTYATGTVTFFDNAVSLGTTALSGATPTASLVVPNLGIRTHSVTATYNGDTNFLASTSPSALITVTQDSSATTLSANATTIQVGSTVTFAATAPTNATGTVTFFDNTVPLGTAILSGTTPSASLLITSLGARTHSITATYNGDSVFLASTSTPITITVTPNTPTLQLGSLQNASAGSTLTFNALLAPLPAGTKPNNPAPTGSVQYSDGATILGSSPLVALADGSGNYAAPFTAAAIKPGPHTITAAYAGDANYTAATSIAQSFSVGLTTTSLATSPSTAQVGTTITLTAIVSAPATGTVSFFDNGVSLGSAAIAGTAATLTVSTFTARMHSLTATYNGDSNDYVSTSPAFTLSVTQNTPSLQLVTLQSTSATPSITILATLTPAPSGTKPPNPAPAGSIQYSDGTTVIGSAQVTALTDGSGNYGASFTTSSLSPGTHPIAALYTGDSNYAAALASAQIVRLGLTNTTLTSSAATVGLGTPFTLTAKITPVISSAASIGGTVIFSDGTTILGTANVTAGMASLSASLSTTASATHTITAIYSGDANFFTSTAAGIAVTTVIPGIAAAISPGSLVITRGSSGSAVISLTATGNYSGTITPTCAGLPSLTTCTFSPTSLSFSGVNATQTMTVTIATTAPPKGSRLLWLPALFLAGLVTVRRRQLSHQTCRLLVLAVMAGSLLAITGCGSSTLGSSTATTTGGTPIGTSAVTVNLAAVGATSVSPTTQTAVTLSVTIQ